MPHTNAWNNASPLGSEFASSIDNHMRAMKLDTSERMSIAFIWNTSQTYDGYPKTLPFRADDDTSLISTSQANNLTGSSAHPMFDLAQTWNTSGSPTALKLNITNTASGASALLMDLQVGGVSMVSVTKDGTLSALTGLFGATIFTGTVSARAILPSVTATYDLGNPSFVWANAYLSNVVAATATYSGAVTFDGTVTFNSTVVGGISTSSMTLTGNLTVGGATALNGAVDIAGGLTAGSGNVGIIDSTGKIPAISSTYFASLVGTSLTGVAMLASTNTFSAVNNFVGYSETSTALTISSNVLSVDMSLGSSFTFTMNANITTMTITNIPASGKFGSFVLFVTANGTSYTWTWFSSTVKWPGGTAPTRTTTSGRMDVFYFYTTNGGSTWFGSTVGQNYTP